MGVPPDVDPITFDVNVSDSYGRTALHYAAEQGHAMIIDIGVKPI